jgi:SPX domain protein involved in polyphosphate accumulation
VLDLLDKIKNKDMKEIFKNKYKRLSFVYKGDPSIRMTIDTNLTYIVNGQENEVNFDILEVKYPKDMDISTIYSFFSEINELANTNIEFKKFSKMEYGYFHFMKRS